MMSVVRLLAVAAFCLLAFAAPASAQYVYLDSNGDGVHTAADQLNANGVATPVSLYIITNENRDASVAECNTADGELTINSYGIALQASGGTVTFALANAQAGMTTVLEPLASNTTDFKAGYGGGTINPPGKYLLMSGTITGTGGAPSIAVVGDSPLPGGGSGYTFFGTLCSGNDFDNTYKLIGTTFGTGDFADVDGLGAAPGGNLDPVITAPATANGTENSPFSVAASATDPEAGNVTLTQTNNAPFLTGPASAGPAANPSITLSGTPDFTQAGSYTVNWSAADATTGTATASTAITIANLNRNPAITAPATASGAENSLVTVVASATDPDGDNVGLSQTNNAAFLAGPTTAGPSPNPSITLTGTPSFSQAGSYTINWSATSTGGGTAAATTALTISNVNRNPAITAPATVNRSEGDTLTVTGSASDPDGDNVTLSQTNNAAFLTGPASAGPASNPSITLVGTPGFDQAGAYTINWSAADATTGTATASTALTIANVNRNPAITAPASVNGAENSPVSIVGSASDPDGENVTLSQTNNAAFLAGPASAGPSANPSITLTGTPNFSQAGSYTVNWSAADNTTGTANAATALTIANTDQPVVLNPIGDITTVEGSTGSTAVSASDADGETVTLTPNGFPAFATLNAPTSGVGSVSTTVTASPAAGAAASSPYPVSITAAAGLTSDTENFSIIVTSGDVPPVLAPIGAKTIAEGASTDYPISASDADGDLIEITASLPSFGALNAPTSGTGTVSTSFNLAPGFSAAGTHSGTVTATANGLADSETFVITVTNTNRPPSLAAIAPINVAEGASASTPVSASDADGDLITLSIVSLPSFATLDAPLTGTGSVATTITAAPGFADAGSYSGSIRASDPSNADATGGVSITVTNTDRGPALDPIANVTVGQGGSASRNVNASDPDGDVVELTASLPAFAVLNAPLSGTGGVATTISINPLASTTIGDYPASVTATAILLSDVENFTITVTRTNQAIVLDPIADVTLDEGSSSSVTVNASDADNDLITLTASLPAFATLLAPTSGTGTVTTAVTINPGFGDAGVYPSSVTADDGLQPVTEPFTITVNNVDRPVALDPIADLNVAEGASASRSVSASDPDGETIALTASLPLFATLDAPTSGAGAVSTTVTASPAAGDAGSYPSSVTATANLLADTENFTIVVTVPNQAPTVSSPAAQAVDEGQNLNFAVTATDGDNDPLTLTATNVPQGASFLDNGNGSGTFDWTPGFNQAGVYTVVFNVSDGKGGSDSDSTLITVNNVNRCPTADAGGPYTGVVNIPVSFDGSASSDPDGDPLTYAWSFGDGGNGTGASVSHAYTTGGTFNVTLTVDDGLCTDGDLTTATIVTEFPALVFTTGGNNTTSLGAGKPTTCVQIEPIGGSFVISDVDLTSIRMISAGTGSVSAISAIGGKTTIDGDKNQNGATEIRACFSKADLRLLFSALPAGRNTVTVTIEGNLTTGGTFRGTLVHTVKATGGALAATVSPNPLNPETTLSFQLRTPGRVTVKIFDLNGRLVKTLLDDARGAGYQDLTWNGTTDGGAKVASGIYYFRLDTPEGRIVKAATVLK